MPDHPVRPYAEAALTVAVSTLIGLAIAPRWGSSAVDLLYLPAVLGAAIRGGLKPALFSALASALAFNFFFTTPSHSFHVDSPADLVTVLLLFLVATVTSHLAAAMRGQARLAEAHANRNATIAGLARQLLSCTSEGAIAEVVANELARLFQCNALVVRGSPVPAVIASVPPKAQLGPGDLAAAAAAMGTGSPAGRGVLPAASAQWQFHPLRSNASGEEAVGLARDDGTLPVNQEQLPLLGNLLDQVALALERARLEGEAREFAAIRERDALRAALLATIGDDLAPALKTIRTRVDELRRSGSGEKALVAEIGTEAARLARYLENLAHLNPVSDQQPVVSGSVTIDLFQRSVLRDGQQVHLTPKEYAVLAELAKQPGRVLTHAHLLRAVWGPAQETQIDYLRVAVRGLRQKLEGDAARPRMIINEPAVGYRLATD